MKAMENHMKEELKINGYRIKNNLLLLYDYYMIII